MQVCVQLYRDVEGEQEEGKDPGVFDACWLGADGRIGMVNQAQQREEGVFFSTQAVVCGSRDRKGQGCVSCCSVPVLFVSLFFSTGPQSSWGSRSTKRLALSQDPKPGLWSGVKLFDKPWLNNTSYLTCRRRYRHALIPASDRTEV